MTRRRRLRGRAPPKTRVVGYAFEIADEGVVQAEKILDAALVAKTITQFDTGNGFVWWNGPPGEGMRAVKSAIAAMPGATPVRN